MIQPSNDGSDERKFLHDLASPLATAMLSLEGFLLQYDDPKHPPPDAGEKRHLIRAFDALNAIRSLLEQRRKVLVDRGIPSSRPR